MSCYNEAWVYPEIWGGIECSINRCHHTYKDQLHLANHYGRAGDLETLATLGIKTFRYPVLWEHHCPQKNCAINWNWSSRQLNTLRRLKIQPIAGLLHHGSGPAFTSLLDKDFPVQLASYAKKVAIQFPWLEYYTPVNEPLTTARFSGLYGLWYPHLKNEHDFLTMLLNQVEGIILSMRAIREINPLAKLVQTEDIGQTHSTPNLRYQARFENHRRWLTYDLLCGKIDETHPLWTYFLDNGISVSRLYFFLENSCVPDIAGFNHYVTSERYLDDDVEKFPHCVPGTNGKHFYVDCEAVRFVKVAGIKSLLREAWQRYQIPLAVTETHLHCSREDQLRWFKEIWDNCCELRNEGVDIRAVTAWALLGAYDWDKLLTSNVNNYEVGVFDIRDNTLRPTAMVNLIRALATSGRYEHPLLKNGGWWHRHNPANKSPVAANGSPVKPLLITGNPGGPGEVFKTICDQRGIENINLLMQDFDPTQKSDVDNLIEKIQPWAVIDTVGHGSINQANNQAHTTTADPHFLSIKCKKLLIPYLYFSSDVVLSKDNRFPCNEFKQGFPNKPSKNSGVEVDHALYCGNAEAYIIKISTFLGLSKKDNFAHELFNAMPGKKCYCFSNELYASPDCVSDIVNAALDLFIDKAVSSWQLPNDERLIWPDFPKAIA